MAIREIRYNVTSSGVTPSSHLWGGVQNEDNATKVVYYIDAEYLSQLSDALFRIDFDSAQAGYNPSENLTLTDLTISREIPKEMTQYGGNMYSTLVITKADLEVIQIPSTIFFTSSNRTDKRFAENLSAFEVHVSELLTEMDEKVESARVNAENASGASANASTSAILAQGAETNATKKASEAEQSAKDAYQHAQDAFVNSLTAGDRAHDADKYAGDAAIKAEEAYRYATDAKSACVAAQDAEENAKKYAEDAKNFKVDLSDYVKKTQFADRNGNAGVLRLKSTYGISSGRYDGNSPESGDTIIITKAGDSEIKARQQNYKPIVPSNLDYAVKMALTDSKIEWTEEEKKAVRLLLGIDKPYETILEDYLVDSTGIIHGIKINVGEKYIVSVYNVDEKHPMIENKELIVQEETYRVPETEYYVGMYTSGNFYYGMDGYEDLFIQQVAPSTIQVKFTNWSPDGMPSVLEGVVKITLIKVNV